MVSVLPDEGSQIPLKLGHGYFYNLVIRYPTLRTDLK
jgi:hypothetical protein